MTVSEIKNLKDTINKKLIPYVKIIQLQTTINTITEKPGFIYADTDALCLCDKRGDNK